MCRNIKTLFNFDPPVTEEEVRAASLQFVRKISGLNKPSKANEGVFQAAVEEIAGISTRLLVFPTDHGPAEDGVQLAQKGPGGGVVIGGAGPGVVGAQGQG